MGCAFVVTGLRDVDWTAIGRDIVLYTAGMLLAAGQIRRTPRDSPGNPLSAFAVAEGDSSVARREFTSLVIACGVDRGETSGARTGPAAPLHQVTIGRFPEVVAREQSGFCTQS
ncbi:hypothetical protein [Nocardia asiatica]|uniref:hypothetical protein n=1 Tax=Nocardia asiatica TaxID=209252 RepID=UPI0006849965|nr:hypothetical protein [Nocardia asiatica]